MVLWVTEAGVGWVRLGVMVNRVVLLWRGPPQTVF